MKNSLALELLRLVTFLPLTIVLLAMLSEDQYGIFQQREQVVSQELAQQTSCFWEG